VDPYYLSWKAKQSGFDPRFIELAGIINGSMPHYVVEKVAEALNSRRKALNGSSILVAGVAYKRDIDDLRESPALDVMGLLHGKGAKVAYLDPYIAEVPARSWSGQHTLTSASSDPATFSSYDCIVIVTDHRAFDYAAMLERAPVIVDTRNAIKVASPNVYRLGAPAPERRAPATESDQETSPSAAR
jgi:UDP-N-acetyl-D-glucosamine dehydrogenase